MGDSYDERDLPQPKKEVPKFASMSECRRIATTNPGLMAEKFRDLRLAYDELLAMYKAAKREREEMNLKKVNEMMKAGEWPGFENGNNPLTKANERIEKLLKMVIHFDDKSAMTVEELEKITDSESENT